jgi:hypothetical protein
MRQNHKRLCGLPSSHRQRNSLPRKESNTPAKRSGTALTTIVATVSLTGVFLSLMGFGVALAFGTRSGVSTLRIAESAFTCLKLSSLAILHAFVEIGQAVLFPKDDHPYLLTSVVVAIVAMICFVLFVAARASSKTFSSARTPATRLGKWVEIGCYRLNSLYRKAPHLFQTTLAGSAGGAFGVAVMHIFLALFLVVLFFIVLVPWMGFVVGSDYYFVSVIEPNECLPIVSHSDQKQRALLAKARRGEKPAKVQKPYAAQCIEIRTMDGEEVAKGRLVTELSDAVLLYYPKSGDAEIIPTKDMRIRQIGALMP